MIDIHSHILYDIPGDDGARDRSMSLDMLRQAAEAGTRELFATPHFHRRGICPSWDVITERLAQLQQAADDTGYVAAIFLFDRFQGAETVFHRFVQHDSQNGSPAHADFFGHNDGGLHVFDNRVHSEYVAWNHPSLHDLYQMGLQFAAVIFLECIFG